tara:strand:- start:545 stop:718 length:174 start_codon:yes stop_codon:yes gene_type:complete
MVNLDKEIIKARKNLRNLENKKLAQDAIVPITIKKPKIKRLETIYTKRGLVFKEIKD